MSTKYKNSVIRMFLGIKDSAFIDNFKYAIDKVRNISDVREDRINEVVDKIEKDNDFFDNDEVLGDVAKRLIDNDKRKK